MTNAWRMPFVIGSIGKLAYGAGAIFAPEWMAEHHLAPTLQGHADPRMSLRGFGGAQSGIAVYTLATATSPQRARTVLGLNKCTSGDQTWSATRGKQPSQPPGVGKAGTYNLTESQNANGGSFTVSASRTEIQDLRFSNVGLDCHPSGGTSTPITPSSLNVDSDGSFSTEFQQTETVNGLKQTFAIKFSGHFHGVDSTGASRAAGSYRVTGTFTKNGTVFNCNSNKQWWYAVRTG